MQGEGEQASAAAMLISDAELGVMEPGSENRQSAPDPPAIAGESPAGSAAAQGVAADSLLWDAGSRVHSSPEQQDRGLEDTPACKSARASL